jgi:type I restriction enzyme, S subunit
VSYPGTWKLVTIGESLDLINGRAFKPKEWATVGRPIVRIQNLNNPKAAFNYYAGELPEKFSVASGDLLFAWSGTPGTSFGAHVWKGPDAWLNQHIFKVVFPRDVFDRRFLQLAINQNLSAYIGVAHGGAGLAHITKGKFEASTIPLPPLAEQKRIVAKIEELFSELEAGEESLRVARQQLGVYRQSLLKQAFEGKLTAQWRTQNPDKVEDQSESEIPNEELGELPDLPIGWRYTRFGRLIRHIDAGKSFRCEERRPTADEIGVAKVSAVTWGEYDEAESKTCIDPEKVNSDYFIRRGDFILSRANTIELVGACVMVRRVTQRVMLSDKTLRLTIDDAVKPFVLHYLRSRQGRREIEKRSTGNQESMRNIGQDRIRSIVLAKCSLPEQQEIVRLLEQQFEVIDQNEREIDAALKRSEALRQSILKEAFSGRLVPQDPSDEPASELLARLRVGRLVSEKPPRLCRPPA